MDPPKQWVLTHRRSTSCLSPWLGGDRPRPPSPPLPPCTTGCPPPAQTIEHAPTAHQNPFFLQTGKLQTCCPPTTSLHKIFVFDSQNRLWHTVERPFRVYGRGACCREAVGQFIGKVWSRLARNNLQGGVPSVWRVVSCWASTTWEEPAAWILQDQSQPILRTSLHNTRIWWSQLSLLHQKAWKYFTQNLLRVLSSSRPYQALVQLWEEKTFVPFGQIQEVTI